jgi:predicted metalloprotease
VIPDPNTIRDQALIAGGVDPMFLRFRVVELEQETGQVLGIQAYDIGFREAVEMTQSLLQDGRDSHFCLEPVGFLQ